jgi:Ca2+-binding EF-hand superfamily protein
MANAPAPATHTMSGVRSLRTQAGDRLSIDKMAIPESLKDLVRELDLDGKGEVNEENLRESVKLMNLLKNGLDTDGSGGVTAEEMEAGVALLTRLAKGRAMNSSELDYKHMPECIQGVMREWDADGSGKVSVGELAAAAQAFKKIQQEGRLMKKIILGLSIVILILMVGMFVLSLAAAEMAKESFVEGGKSTDKAGNVVATRSSDFEVCPDGTMASWGKCPVAGTGRRLEESAGDMLKTVSTKQKQSLKSSLADAFFMALNEVSVFSDKGHTLRLTIHGFARVPAANSRCGNIVHLYTAWNGRLTLDSTDLSFDKETEAAFLNAGFSLVMGGVSGRRLAGEHVIDGFFSAVQGVEAAGWTCKDVPLPSLPPFFSQHFTIFTPCGVEGLTGDIMDQCDSRFGGALPGASIVSRELQLATMTKTERIRASLSVNAPITATIFAPVEVEIMKSDGYELQISKFPNHPGQVKVDLFDRKAKQDAQFQIIEGRVGDGRFFCKTSGSESTAQKVEEAAAAKNVRMDLHFEYLDMVEEQGKLLRHFRMMPSDAFLGWMGAKNASQRAKEDYFEYWDVADTMAPFRIMNPDGTLIVFKDTTAGATDDIIRARLAQLGSAAWTSILDCTSAEQKVDDAHSPSLDMKVPRMLSPTIDLQLWDMHFYARLYADNNVEEIVMDDGSRTANQKVGMATLRTIASSTHGGPLTSFAKYAFKVINPVAMPDLCRDSCKAQMAALEAELTANPLADVCHATATAAAIKCIADVASVRNILCMQSNFMHNIDSNCIPAAERRRLEEIGSDDVEFDDENQGMEDLGRASDWYFRKLGLRHQQGDYDYRSSGLVKSGMRKLRDGTTEMNLDALDAAQREQLAKAIGVKDLKGGRLYFNLTEEDRANQKGHTAILQTTQSSGAEERRLLLALDLSCVAPGVTPGCLFYLASPPRCNPITGKPRCSWGIGIKIQIGGPDHGAFCIAGSGTVRQNIPKPLSATLKIEGGLELTGTPACPGRIRWGLKGSIGITASIGLDLNIIYLAAASLSIKGGFQVESGNGRCEVKVFLRGEMNILMVQLWAELQYYLSSKSVQFWMGVNIRCLWWWQDGPKHRFI